MTAAEAVAAVLADVQPAEDVSDVARDVLEALANVGWHGASDCPECEQDHCDDPDVHDAYDVSALAEAVQMLHAQAHRGPGDSLYAQNCRREPCATVGGIRPDDGAAVLFTPGSRVVA